MAGLSPGAKAEPVEPPLREPVTSLAQLSDLLDGLEQGVTMALLAETAPGRHLLALPPELLAFAFDEERCYYLEPAGFKQPAEIFRLIDRAFERSCGGLIELRD